MKRQYRLREDEALHEWLDRLMESMPLRQLSDCELRDVLRDISVQSYIQGSRDREAIEEKDKQMRITQQD